MIETSNRVERKQEIQQLYQNSAKPDTFHKNDLGPLVIHRSGRWAPTSYPWAHLVVLNSSGYGPQLGPLNTSPK